MIVRDDDDGDDDDGSRLFPSVVPLLKNMPSLPSLKNMPTLPKKIIACEKGQSAEDEDNLNVDNLNDEDDKCRGC